jgi:hypothetical protein
MRQMKAWQIAVVAAIVLGAAAFTAVAIAAAGEDGDRDDRAAMMGSGGYGAPQGENDEDSPGSGQQLDGDGCDQEHGRGQQGGGMGQGEGMGQGGGMMGPGGGEGLRGLDSQLTEDQRQQLQDLMEEHRADMQAWSDKYGENPDSAAAQEAFQGLRTEHRQKMNELLDELGIERGGRGMWQNDDDASPDAGTATPCPDCDSEAIGY